MERGRRGLRVFSSVCEPTPTPASLMATSTSALGCARIERMKTIVNINFETIFQVFLASILFSHSIRVLDTIRKGFLVRWKEYSIL